jgi:UDP:flavonoid glycosyltransferase YjiC (YdhE family)
LTRVGLYVSGHGFGHAVRSAEVARALLHRRARVVVRTDAPAWLFPQGCEHLPSPGWPLDIGVAQHDGLDLDIDETRRRWQVMAEDFERRARIEADLLRRARVDVVLGDVPPLAFAAASRAGVPSAALANFGWDWIYAAWPDFDLAVDTVRRGYGQADLLLRLPLHSPDKDAFQAFSCVEDVRLIARLAQRSRTEVRREHGIPADAQVVLLSFGGFDARGLELTHLRTMRDHIFVLTPPVADTPAELPRNVTRIPGPLADYASLVAACDVVLTKPGYGIVADCLANQVPVLYTDRGPFREYPILVEALTTLGRAHYVPREDVHECNLAAHLTQLARDDRPWTPLRTDGAEMVAARLLKLAH